MCRLGVLAHLDVPMGIVGSILSKGDASTASGVGEQTNKQTNKQTNTQVCDNKGTGGGCLCHLGVLLGWLVGVYGGLTARLAAKFQIFASSRTHAGQCSPALAGDSRALHWTGTDVRPTSHTNNRQLGIGATPHRSCQCPTTPHLTVGPKKRVIRRCVGALIPAPRPPAPVLGGCV